MAREPATLPISEVSRRSGIPITTLRFYERELPGLFRIRKTSGGHRRYANEDVARFVTVRRLTEAEGLRLAEVRRVLMSRGEHEAIREDVDLLLDVHTAETQTLSDLHHRLDTLEARIAALEGSPQRRRRWLGRR